MFEPGDIVIITDGNLKGNKADVCEINGNMCLCSFRGTSIDSRWYKIDRISMYKPTQRKRNKQGLQNEITVSIASNKEKDE